MVGEWWIGGGGGKRKEAVVKIIEIFPPKIVLRVTEKKITKTREASVLTQNWNWYSLQYYRYHMLQVLSSNGPIKVQVFTLLVQEKLVDAL